MKSERFAVPGLLLLLIAALFASTGVALSLTAIPLGIGVVLLGCAVHEALAGPGSRH